jgi:hypothetical protein
MKKTQKKPPDNLHGYKNFWRFYFLIKTLPDALLKQMFGALVPDLKDNPSGLNFNI